MKKILICCIFFNLASLNAQTPVIDSLTKLLKTAKQDTNKVILLNRLIWQHTANGTEKALQYAKEAEELAESLNYEQGVLSTKVGKANTLSSMGKFREAEELYLEAVDRYRKIGNIVAIGRIYNNMAAVYGHQGETDKSIKYLVEAAKIFERHNDPKVNMNLMVNLNIGLIYIQKKEHKNALIYFKRASSYIIDGKDEGYNGAIYRGLGSAYAFLDKYEEALNYFMLAEKIFTKIGYDNGLASIYVELSAYYLRTYDYQNARLYAKKAITKYGANYMPSEIVGCLINISSSYLTEWNIAKGKKNPVNLDSAFYYQDSALRICKRFNLKELERQGHKSLSTILADQMKYEASLKSLNDYLVLHDSLMSVEKETRINEIQTKYNVEKTETENARLSDHTKNQELIILILSILFITIVAFGILLFRQNKLKTKQKQIQLEQKLLRSQMNPHFIFNALIAIESFIYKNEAKSAGKYLSTFAKLMRMILENSREDYITLEKDIQTLKYYLDLQKLRFNNKFDYDFELAENIDAGNTLIAPMLIQPFIENAIEHGLSHSEEHGKIIISFKKENDSLAIEVKDNGPGFSGSANTTKTHYSMATTIVKERLANLSHKRRKFSLELNDIKENNTVTGAMVRITIPYVAYV